MPRLDFEQTAFVIECFLNAIRLNDGPNRTGLESILVRWLSSKEHHKNDYVVFFDSNVICRSRGKDLSVFETAEAHQDKIVWCDGTQISIIASEPYRESGKIVMLGMEGLDLSMPVAVES